MDKTVYQKKWYRNISFGAALGIAGKSTIASLNAKFDLPGFSFGPELFVHNNAGETVNHLGMTISLYPWHRS
jgi:hypothetical protein